MQDQESIDQQVHEMEVDEEIEATAAIAERPPGEVDTANAEQRSHFFAVANALIDALKPQGTQLWTEHLNRREAESVRLIYEARTAQESDEASGEISGLERMHYLNEGLMGLRGVLSSARAPGFSQARAHVEQIRRQVAQLKQEIAEAIATEEQRKTRQADQAQLEEEKKKAEEEEARAKAKAESSEGEAATEKA